MEPLAREFNFLFEIHFFIFPLRISGKNATFNFSVTGQNNKFHPRWLPSSKCVKRFILLLAAALFVIVRKLSNLRKSGQGLHSHCRYTRVNLYRDRRAARMFEEKECEGSERILWILRFHMLERFPVTSNRVTTYSQGVRKKSTL